MNQAPTFDDKLKQNLPQKIEEKVVEKEKSVAENIAEVYNELVDKQKMYSVKTLTWFYKYMQQIIMVTFSFLLIGIQQFAEPQFNPYFFLQAKFWYEYLPFVTALWLILFATTSGSFKIYMEIDLLYIQLKNEIQDHVNSDSKNPFIEIGCKIDDRERKKRTFKKKVSRELASKIKKYSIGTFDNLVKYLKIDEVDENGEKAILSQQDILLLNGINVSKKKEKRVKASLRALYDMLSDEYVEKVIDNIKIKYNQVTSSLLINGFSPRTKETYEPNFKSNDQVEVISEFGVGQLVTMVMMFVILSLDLMTKEATVATWVFFVLKMFQLTWTYLKASMRSKPIFERTFIKALQERENTLNGYKKKYQVIENNKDINKNSTP